MANNEDTLIREVQEELRRERMEQLFSQYGTYVLMAAIAVVAGIAAFQWNKSRTADAAFKAGAAFEAASNLAADGKQDEAIKSFETLAKQGPEGYAAMARLRLAAAELKAGRKAEATAAYQALASDQQADRLLSSYASLQLAALKIGEADFTEVENRLNDLAREGGPWRANARELLALAALKAGKTDKARSVLEELLADKTTPGSVGQRAQVLMSKIIAGDIAKAAAAPAAGETATDKASPKPAEPVGGEKK
ncbi:MAG: tetratricopeptide repeat protein [Hyphomicrobiaceae bacterium]|nr:tetratricopeptide repeat protein [Hyphomicrobiaceae bacterium]